MITYHVLHGAEHIEARVSNGLEEARLCAFAWSDTDSVPQDTFMGQLVLSLRQPTGGEWEIRQKVHGYNGHTECQRSFGSGNLC